MSPLEVIACLLSLAGVYLTAKQRVIAWPLGAVAVALYAWIFYHVRLYADAFLNAVYVALQLYGWRTWAKREERGINVMPVGHISRRQTCVWLAMAAAAGFAIALFLKAFTNQDYAYVDSAILTFSLVAQYWMARKILACWSLWVAVDFVAAGIYFAKGLHVTAGLYALFLGLAIMGHWDWRHERTVAA